MDDRAIKAQARATDNAGSGSALPEARDGPGRRVAAQARRALSEAIREDRAEAIRKGRGKLAPHPRAEASRCPSRPRSGGLSVPPRACG